MRKRGMRRWLVAVAVLGAAAVTSAASYRVLAPAETMTLASDAYPEPPAANAAPVRLASAPLLVDGRLRVYATTRQVRADGPIDWRVQRTPYWSYRRWPAQLVGVAAVGSRVVSRWSDGELVALDARTGRVAWRATGQPAEPGRYDGGLTGADTLYAPDGLHLASGRLVVREEGRVRALDPATGRELWRSSLSDCQADGFTIEDGRYVAIDNCAEPLSLVFFDAASGQTARWTPPDAGAGSKVEPVGCGVARSDCAGMRIGSNGATRGWVFEGAQPVATRPLDSADSTVVGDVVVAVSDGSAVGQSRDGTEIWRWRKQQGNGKSVELLAVQPGAVHLLTDDRRLVTLDPVTGQQRSRHSLAFSRNERTDWLPGHVLAQDGYVVIERMSPPAGPEDYFTNVPVVLART